MRSTEDPFEFDQFPRGWLAFKVTRRRFLSSLLNNIQVYNAEVPSFGLAELGTWDDEKLGEVIPKVISGTRIRLREGSVYGQPKSVEKPIRLFSKGSPALTAFNQMNGSPSLHKIATAIAAENNWEMDYSFNFVRGLFLWLVLCRICEPMFPKEQAGK